MSGELDELNPSQNKYEDPDTENNFDNEFLKYIAQLAENKSIGDIIDFIERGRWTDNQKRVIMSYAKIILGNGLSTSYLMPNSYQNLFDNKALVDCDLSLGMTTFDLTPEFNILLGLINVHFELESNKSVGGFFVKRIGTQRHEYEHEEKLLEKKQGLTTKILRRL